MDIAKALLRSLVASSRSDVIIHRLRALLSVVAVKTHKGELHLEQSSSQAVAC